MDDDNGERNPTSPVENEIVPPGLEDILKANLEGDLHRQSLEPGMVIEGKWELLRVIGTGGFGQVYEAWHIPLDRPVAIKFLDPQWGDPELRRRFLEEARMMAGLASEHLVRVSDYGELPNGSPYFVMDLVKGRTVREHMRERLSVPRIVEILDGLLQGLSIMHERGVVHADIKPENIIVSDEDGGVRLLDFGSARTSKLRGGVDGVTPPYMAPEMLFENSDACERTDTYAVGVLAYEMLTGRLPRGHGWMNFDRMRRSWESRPSPDSIRMQRPDVPQSLDAFILSVLSRDPSERPESAQAMLEEIRHLAARIATSQLAEADVLPRHDDSTTPEAPSRGWKSWWVGPVVAFAAVAAWWLESCDQTESSESMLASVSRYDEASGTAWGLDDVGVVESHLQEDSSGGGSATSALSVEGPSTYASPTTGSVGVDATPASPESLPRESIPSKAPHSKVGGSKAKVGIVGFRTDQEIAKQLKNKIIGKCGVGGHAKVKIEGLIRSDGKVTGVLITSAHLYHECVRRALSEVRFSKGFGMRPMPRISLEL